MYSNLGDDEVGVADDATTPTRARTPHLQAARAWYDRSDEIYLALRAQGKLRTDQALVLAWNLNQMALCAARSPSSPR